MTIRFEGFNSAFWSCRWGDQLKYVTQAVGLVSWWPQWLFMAFQHSHFYFGFPTEMNSFHRWPRWIFIILIYLFLLCCVVAYVTTSHLELFASSVSWWYLSQFFKVVHTHIHIHIRPHTYTHSVFHILYHTCTIVVIWWYLVITSLTNNILTFHYTIRN